MVVCFYIHLLNWDAADFSSWRQVPIFLRFLVMPILSSKLRDRALQLVSAQTNRNLRKIPPNVSMKVKMLALQQCFTQRTMIILEVFCTGLYQRLFTSFYRYECEVSPLCFHYFRYFCKMTSFVAKDIFGQAWLFLNCPTAFM